MNNEWKDLIDLAKKKLLISKDEYKKLNRKG